MGVWIRGFLRSVRLEDFVTGKMDVPTRLRESVGVLERYSRALQKAQGWRL